MKYPEHPTYFLKGHIFWPVIVSIDLLVPSGTSTTTYPTMLDSSKGNKYQAHFLLRFASGGLIGQIEFLLFTSTMP